VSQVHLTVTGKDKQPGDVTLFFRRWLANPLQMGSIIPSSPRLGELIARNIDKQSHSLILELGAGTGAITKSLIKAGISPGRIAVVEIVPEMADHLRTKFPKTTVLQADAFNLPNQLLKDSAIHSAGRAGGARAGLSSIHLLYHFTAAIPEPWP